MKEEQTMRKLTDENLVLVMGGIDASEGGNETVEAGASQIDEAAGTANEAAAANQMGFAGVATDNLDGQSGVLG
jgi:hypothetical protein